MLPALPEDMQNIYYIAGEGSTITLALCTLGVGAVEVGIRRQRNDRGSD
ncbi:MAG: hypothetical protein K2K46_05595 [Lachnospiraceae bacterium]|nr:hypothetical protein [Lachnospiraceae bacterium]